MTVQTTPRFRRQSKREHNPQRDLLEVAVAFALIEAALWSMGRAQLVWGLLAAVWVAIAMSISRRTASELGIGVAGLRSAVFVIPGAIALSGLILLGAWWAGTLHLLSGTHSPPWHAALYAVWALIQEFLVLSFIFVRLRAVVSREFRAVVGTALLFSAAHIPSLILMCATFLLALLLIAVFRRYRNIYPLAVAHAMLGLALAISLPSGVIHNMRVGIAYWK